MPTLVRALYMCDDKCSFQLRIRDNLHVRCHFEFGHEKENLDIEFDLDEVFPSDDETVPADVLNAAKLTIQLCLSFVYAKASHTVFLHCK
jgi:hypothetical protein